VIDHLRHFLDERRPFVGDGVADQAVERSAAAGFSLDHVQAFGVPLLQQQVNGVEVGAKHGECRGDGVFQRFGPRLGREQKTGREAAHVEIESPAKLD
jgi:hypothetical protein